jgi:hypothetical protein
MRLASVEAIVRALARGDVRYLIVGGLAVNAHGFLRFTKDIDKEAVGREQDRIDAEHLRLDLEEGNDGRS